jgi:hypothetical protein
MRTALLLAVLVLAACHRDGGPIGANRYPPTPENYRIVLYLTKQPTRPYEEIGYFKKQSGSDDPEWATARARSVGADAVILHTNAGSTQQGEIWRNGSSGGSLSEAIAIRWTDLPPDAR